MTGMGWTVAVTYVALVQAISVVNVVHHGDGQWFYLGILLTLPVGAVLYPLLSLLVLPVVLVVGPESNPVVDVGFSLLFGVAAAANVWVVRLMRTELRGAWQRCRLRRRMGLAT